ncbi:porin [uncultured Jannaschia sp.]|uniref:porin n=1 Tax=uncultured Jannaschia sp. TaxID=293347 RepID=UPI0026120FA4|nr:porin [uncultured Jannaschia sp.]
MKKILFASTALVAFAGTASAEILLSGNAELGLRSSERLNFSQGQDEGYKGNDKVGFFTDIDVTFTMTGETDGGLLFGADIDLDESGNGEPFERPNEQGGESIFISGAFGTLTGGDTDGALDFALTEVAFNSGSLNDDETIHAGYNDNDGLDGLYDGQVIRYDYSFGDFAVALSAELDDNDVEGNDEVYGLGVTYQLDLGGTNIGMGLGYQTAEVADTDVDTWGASLNGELFGFAVGVSYMNYNNHVPGHAIADSDFGSFASEALGTDGTLDEDNEVEQSNRFFLGDGDTEHFGIGVGYTGGAYSVSLNYGQYDTPIGDIDGIGLTAGYDLGGGASVQFGYGHSDYSDVEIAGLDDGPDELDTVSFGVRLDF